MEGICFAAMLALKPGNANLPIGELDLDGEKAEEKMPIWPVPP